MKRRIITLALGGVFIANVAYGADHGATHEMMHGSGGAATDERVELTLPPPMKVMQKAMMRVHMDQVAEITGALAVNDLKKAARIARTKLGWNDEEGERCERVAKVTKQPEFMDYAKGMHSRADALADAAEADDRDKALVHLAELITSCNACHHKFRH